MNRRDRSDSSRSRKSSASSSGDKARKRTSLNELELEMAKVLAGMPFHNASSQNTIPGGSSSPDHKQSRNQRATAHTAQDGHSGLSTKDSLSGPVPSHSSLRAQMAPRKRRKGADGQAQRACPSSAIQSGPSSVFHPGPSGASQAAPSDAFQPETSSASQPRPSHVLEQGQSGASLAGPSGASQSGPSGAFHPGSSGVTQPGLSNHRKPRRECNQCGKKFHSEWAAMKHRRECQVVLRCSKCQFQARSRATLAKHEKSHYDRVCEICGFTTGHRQKFYDHMKTHDEESTCDVCGKKYLRKASLKRHMRDTHRQQ
ncbi:hypothetical protein BWQ96_04920 [Gracilariopsis chorda]|uniref:C2H2-type domain-containing protein n=1 Tax=Gracilariopsis chorda TaxID=448386 RepID=A0A2V3IW15_9FLOR|nr:hypothetical protein BWQ96_04920 [Gracilariopsis chorda]|eukprot:PXF45330.1 hypothetical protein BWQ96_04920 [Gracilariopsis chorda]